MSNQTDASKKYSAQLQRAGIDVDADTIYEAIDYATERAYEAVESTCTRDYSDTSEELKEAKQALWMLLDEDWLRVRCTQTAIGALDEQAVLLAEGHELGFVSPGSYDETRKDWPTHEDVPLIGYLYAEDLFLEISESTLNAASAAYAEYFAEETDLLVA